MPKMTREEVSYLSGKEALCCLIGEPVTELGLPGLPLLTLTGK